MTNSKVLKWVSGSLELFLAIPILGALVVMGSYYTVLGAMLVLHIVTLVLSKQNNEPIYGSVLGIITSLVAWIPLVGWILHLLSGIFLMVTAAQKSKPPASHHY
ncbi:MULTISPECIES: hypothetical protein [Paenibacillus]|uniref:Uncharacterized protein n=1 Tax=Paenibacillus oceani TaxID=2772510 RepID=A0A927CD28_9BACL|nr:hypothetical protein [Paenibacillus oceani]MBD2864597.1 hypothetical protein [Paenibacillus oceani]MDF2661182.1 rane protein [Paenibacillus sp.]